MIMSKISLTKVLTITKNKTFLKEETPANVLSTGVFIGAGRGT